MKTITNFLLKVKKHHRLLFTLSAFLFISVSSAVFGQVPGSLDQSFNVGTGTNGSVYASAIQSDGKIVLGGGFNTYNGIFTGGITRLNSDGTIDGTFNSNNIGANGSIYAIKIQNDGKIVIGGDFTSYNGITVGRIARLNPNGTLDLSFNQSGSGASGFISTIAIQADGKVIIGGGFTAFNGLPHNCIIRLNGSDGSIDGSFNTGTGANHFVLTIALQTDGK